MSDKFVKNYYQGVYLTETIMGNPNGDFLDNSPRNFDGIVFTTDKCIKYNIRKYIHDNFEHIPDNIDDIDENSNIVFFFPRPTDKSNMKFKSRETVFKELFNNDLDKLVNCSPDVRMFGGTFSVEGAASQIYGPIQLSYGIDINKAQIKMSQIGAPFAKDDNDQKTIGSEAVVDDAIISYDISINPNNYVNLLSNEDLELFKKSLWFGTNSRKSTSKKTDSKLLILIKFKNNDNDKVTAMNIGELNRLISVKNIPKSMNDILIELDCIALKNKLESYKDFIESIECIYDPNEINLINFYGNDDHDEFGFEHIIPNKLGKDL